MTRKNPERGAVAGPRVRDRGCYGGSPHELSRRELLAAGVSLAVFGAGVMTTRDRSASGRLSRWYGGWAGREMIPVPRALTEEFAKRVRAELVALTPFDTGQIREDTLIDAHRFSEALLGHGLRGQGQEPPWHIPEGREALPEA